MHRETPPSICCCFDAANPYFRVFEATHAVALLHYKTPAAPEVLPVGLMECMPAQWQPAPTATAHKRPIRHFQRVTAKRLVPESTVYRMEGLPSVLTVCLSCTCHRMRTRVVLPVIGAAARASSRAA